MGIDVSAQLGHVGIRSIRTELTGYDALEVLASLNDEGNVDADKLVLSLGPSIAGVTPDVIFKLSGDEAVAMAAVCEMLADQLFGEFMSKREAIVKEYNPKPVSLGGYVKAEMEGSESKLAIVGEAIGKSIEDVGKLPAATFLALHSATVESKKGGPKTAAVLESLLKVLLPKQTEEATEPSELH